MPVKNGSTTHAWYFRITQADMERIRVQAKHISKKVGVTVPLTEVLRKCVSLGLAQLERGK